MRILMLGWEFPPFISGGLGTACYGLTKALDRLGHEVTFVLPKSVDHSHASHVRLLTPEKASEKDVVQAGEVLDRIQRAAVTGEPLEMTEYTMAEFENVRFRAVPAMFSSPYGDGGPVGELTEIEKQARLEAATRLVSGASAEMETKDDPFAPTPGFLGLSKPGKTDYAGDLLGDVRRYSQIVLAVARNESYDVIHAHDWMTYPAGMAIARLTGVPLVVHVHSTEFDRSGENVNQQVYDIERRGMHSAMRVITVSYWTRNIIMHRYGVDAEKVRVVWNGVDQEQPDIERPPIQSNDKIVLFLGRITMQKGPEYFIAAARRVLEKIDNVKFIVAGSGDMATRMIELAACMGIGHKVLFTGFLRGRDVDRVFRMADCYVMPSVSEPFGIAPLEAMNNDVPVIISKQSGVSEVLTHVLKVDFWDVDEMANKIIAVLRHPPLSQTLRRHGSMELRSITWDGAADKCTRVYQDAAHGMTAALV